MLGLNPVCDRHKAFAKLLRNIDQCVDIDVYDSFIRMPQNLRYLCGEVLTVINPPTLDRINNELGHSLSNCKLGCASFNTLRKHNDDHITLLRIQLTKYCKVHHLPITVWTRTQYQFWRNAIIGGLRFVLHRVNISGETCINCNRYDFETKKLINYDTPHVIIHTVGFDGSSLHPSSFSSLSHPFNPYTDHIM